METNNRSGNGVQKRRVWWIGSAVGVAVLAFAGYSLIAGTDNAQAQDETNSQTAIAFIGDLADEATASGQVVSQQEAAISTGSPGFVAEINVRPGDLVVAGDTLVQLETDDLEIALARAEQALALQEANLESLQEPSAAADIDAAEAAVRNAQASLDALLAGPSDADIIGYESDVAARQANVTSAAATVNSVASSVTDAQIASAQANVANAQLSDNNARRANDENPNIDTDTALQDAEANLAIAQANLDTLLSGPGSDSLGETYASLSAAQANLEVTEANYASFLEGASPADIAAAHASLAQAESNLASLLEGASAQDLMVAEAQLAQAQIALDDARTAVSEASIVAPFDGMVTAVEFSVGEYANGVVVTMISTEYEVLLQVDEIDIGAIAIGQEASVTLESWPSVAIPARVSAIAPGATANGSGLVTYEVELTLAETELNILAGMTANAALITANRDDVLLVPNAAITADRSNDSYSVTVLFADGTTEEVPVSIGLNDSDYTQIMNGLQAGDELLIGELVVPVSDDNGFGPPR